MCVCVCVCVSVCVCVCVCFPNTYVFITGCGISGDLPTAEYRTINDFIHTIPFFGSVSQRPVCDTLSREPLWRPSGRQTDTEYKATKHRQNNYNLSLSTRILQLSFNSGGWGGGGHGLS